MRAVAVIPAKSHSSRVANKNFREFFNGKSLLEIKIAQCLTSGAFEQVYVSSDSIEAKAIVESSGAQFLLRDERLCLDSTPWCEVLTGVLDSVPVDDDTHIGWTHLTSPLFDRFKDAIELIENTEGADSVMTVTRLQHYFLNSDFVPINYQWGPWHSYTQKIKPLYQTNCAYLGATKRSMIQNRFPIGDRPVFLQTSMVEGIDIDMPEEFEMAAFFYAKKAIKPQCLKKVTARQPG